MRFFFRKPAPNAAQSLTEPRLIETQYVAINLDPKGKALLETQLDRDIDGKARGWTPIPYTQTQLNELKKLLARKPESDLVSDVLYTHQERLNLMLYVTRYLVRARDIDDTEKLGAYKALIATLTDLSTLIKLPL